MKWARATFKAAAPLALIGVPAACVHVKTDPVEIKPIHIVADVNVNVKIERELDDAFGFTPKAAPATTQSVGARATGGAEEKRAQGRIEEKGQS